MATDYGTDIRALDDLPDPEELAMGEENAAYAVARRLLTTSGALDDIGDESPYDSIDLRDFFGRRMSGAEVSALAASVQRIEADDARVARAFATVSSAGHALTVVSQVVGTEGPFGLVLSVDGVNAASLKVT